MRSHDKCVLDCIHIANYFKVRSSVIIYNVGLNYKLHSGNNWIIHNLTSYRRTPNTKIITYTQYRPLRILKKILRDIFLFDSNNKKGTAADFDFRMHKTPQLTLLIRVWDFLLCLIIIKLSFVSLYFEIGVINYFCM